MYTDPQLGGRQPCEKSFLMWVVTELTLTSQTIDEITQNNHGHRTDQRNKPKNTKRLLLSFILFLISDFPLKSEEIYFSPIGQEYPFLQVSEIFLSRPAVSA